MKKKEAQINNTGNEKGGKTIDTVKIKKIKEYHQQLNA